VLLFIGIAKSETIGYWKFRREKWTLEDFVTRLPRDNVQCKFIAGAVYQEPCTAEICERAKENLVRHFSVVGLLERFEESLALMNRRFGWTLENYSSFNVARTRPHKHDVSKSTLDLIQERNRFDIELYECGAKLFQAGVNKNAGEVSGILRELEAARIQNRLSSARFSICSAGKRSTEPIQRCSPPPGSLAGSRRR